MSLIRIKATAFETSFYELNIQKIFQSILTRQIMCLVVARHIRHDNIAELVAVCHTRHVRLDTTVVTDIPIAPNAVSTYNEVRITVLTNWLYDVNKQHLFSNERSSFCSSIIC